MAETFNPIISHLYCGQGGTSTEVTKYDNATISEINVVDNGVTTKYDFGGLYNEKMYSGNRVWNQLADCTNPTTLSHVGNVISSKLFAFNTNHKYLFIFDVSFQTTYTGVRFSVGIWNNAMTTYKRRMIDADSLNKRYTLVTNGTSAIDSGTLSDFSSVKVAIQVIDPSETIVSSSNKATVSNVQCIDLTDRYGAGNEPSTYAEFYHDYSELYYPYNAGTNFSLATKLFSTIKQPLDSIKFYGNTMRWCQLVQNGNFADTSGWTVTNGTITSSGNVAEVTFTDTTAASSLSRSSFSRLAGHKYFCSCQIKLKNTFSQTGATFGFSGINNACVNGSTTEWQTLSYIDTETANRSVFLPTVYKWAQTALTGYFIKNFMIIDLTYIFGDGNEPTTVSDFTRRLKKLYYPYTPGEILSVEQASAYLYGLNLWDEEWEVGGINDSTGEKIDVQQQFRSKNFVMVFPNKDYYFVADTSAYSGGYIYFYDANKSFLSRAYVSSSYDVRNKVVTTPQGCHFILFKVQMTSGTGHYNNDICISLSNASTNGTYEASKGEQKMQLDSFNLWDEEWELGRLSWNTGENTASSSNIRSKNYIPIVGGSAHYVEIPTGRVEVFYYDYNKGFIGYSTFSLANQIFTPPASACYMRFYTQQAYGTTYNHDICINLSDPSRNGTYVPYRGYVELNCVNDIVDTVTVEKATTVPFGLVDLGTLDWLYESGSAIFYALVSGIKSPSAGTIVGNFLCGKYERVARNSLANSGEIALSTNDYINIKDSAYTDAATFKTAMSGVYLYYELADYPLNDTPILAGSYVKKIGEVDIGTLDWTYDANGDYFYNTSNLFKYVASLYDVPNLLCVKYATVSFVDGADNIPTGWISMSTNQLIIKDTNYSTAEAFTTAMNGVYAVIELSTPVETTLTEQECAQILNGAFTKSKYSTLLIGNNNGQIDQTVDVGMWEQR